MALAAPVEYDDKETFEISARPVETEDDILGQYAGLRERLKGEFQTRLDYVTRLGRELGIEVSVIPSGRPSRQPPPKAISSSAPSGGAPRGRKPADLDKEILACKKVLEGIPGQSITSAEILAKTKLDKQVLSKALARLIDSDKRYRRLGHGRGTLYLFAK